MDAKTLTEMRRLAVVESGPEIPRSDQTGEDEDNPPLWRQQWSHMDDFHSEYGDIGKDLSAIQRQLSQSSSELGNTVAYVRKRMKNIPGVFDPAKSEVDKVLAEAEKARALSEDAYSALLHIQGLHKSISKKIEAHAFAEYEKWKAEKKS